MRLNHIGLLVTDLDKARYFYSDILGFKEIERPKFSIPGVWYSLHAFQLHLMLYQQPKQAHYHPSNETVQAHFSLELSGDRFNEIVEKLEKHGIEIIEAPISSDKVVQLFFYDYDGNMLEIFHQQ